ncbi:hypothetical protein [Paenibacillus massiliensis]|uniref:hypothetical protein n=1 Tax=Paenibacillus massiliensis TaxID=225917 RepID=UPI000365A604|nr:hypothetical protein [Paenibacillus massiliensis]
MKNKLPLDTVLTLMRSEKILGLGSDLEELIQLFVKYVKNPLSTDEVEYCLAQYLAKSDYKDTIHRNNVLGKVTRFINQFGWRLPDYHLDYYRKYLPLFR